MALTKNSDALGMNESMPTLQVCVDSPLVTAVIPTRGRPEFVIGAVHSALSQTYPNIEVVVVLDGPDAATLERMHEIDDPRLRVIALGNSAGGSEARNRGVQSARGEWIAFLDDDDAWLPEKIALQMKQARSMAAAFPVISSRVIAKTPLVAFPLPRKLYAAGQQVGDYLFCPESMTKGGGMMQTSTLLAPRKLLLEVPFRTGLQMHQDWDWLLHAAKHEGVQFLMLPEALAMFATEDGRTSTGRKADWEFSLRWIREVRGLVSPEAYSSFIAVQCMWRAVKSRAGIVAYARLLRAFAFEGRVSIQSIGLFFVFWLIPERARKSLRNWICARTYLRSVWSVEKRVET